MKNHLPSSDFRVSLCGGSLEVSPDLAPDELSSAGFARFVEAAAAPLSVSVWLLQAEHRMAIKTDRHKPNARNMSDSLIVVGCEASSGG